MRIPFLSLGALLLIATNVTAELPDWTLLVDRARWAANAHNVQSWQLLPVADHPEKKRLVLDPSRLLPQTDPPNRQLTISLGTFLAVLEDEAALRGARVAWEPLADGTAGALLTMSEGSVVSGTPEVDALTAPTVKYRTEALVLDREFLKRQEFLSSPTVRVRWLTDDAEVNQALVWASGAYQLEMGLPRTRDESIVYTHYGESARKKTPWGITLLPNFPQADLWWVETVASLFPQSPQEYARSANQMMEKALKPVRQILVVTSKGNGVVERIETGRLLQRLWQQVRARGGELLPLSQGLQEFPEMAAFSAEAHQRWARDGETVQMVLAAFRPAGGPFLPSPRLPATAIVK